MSIEGALWKKLTDTEAISDLVGTRIYPVELPEAPTYPAIAYQRMPGGGSVQSHTLPKSGTASQAMFQINGYATTRRAAQQLMAAVRAAIEAVKWTEDGTYVMSSWCVDEWDIDRDSKARVQGVAQVYAFFHS